MSFQIRPAGPADADQLHAVYLGAFSAPPLNEPAESAARWRDESLPRHAARPGFRCFAAWDGDEMVGFAYGYTGEHGQWWTDQVASMVGPDLAARWLGGHFEFVELAVLPTHERRGLGTALHDVLLAGLPHRVALLTASDDPAVPARRLYQRKGWQVLADRIFEGAALMGRELRPA